MILLIFIHHFSSRDTKTSCSQQRVVQHCTQGLKIIQSADLDCAYYASESLTAAIFSGHYYGRGGPQAVEGKRWSSPTAWAFLKAGEQLGYNVINPNGPEQIGELGRDGHAFLETQVHSTLCHTVTASGGSVSHARSTYLCNVSYLS